MTIVMFLFGLVLLMVGGNSLVSGSVSVARRFGMSPLLIGLTLVGFGTSAPELVASVQASLAGAPGIALGNVVGSNTANILFILGTSALIAPIAVSKQVLRQDSRIMLLATALFAFMCLVAPLTRFVGAFYVLLLLVYIGYSWYSDRKSSAPSTEMVVDEPAKKNSLALAIFLTILGLVSVIVGGDILVSSAVTMAKSYGISQTVIGLTIVAIGTSLPELVTSVVAAFKKQPEIALGNVIGSNIYNLLGIGGLTGILAPTTVTQDIVYVYNPVMLGATIIAVLFLSTGRRLGRVEGFVLLLGYVSYLLSMLFL